MSRRRWRRKREEAGTLLSNSGWSWLIVCRFASMNVFQPRLPIDACELRKEEMKMPKNQLKAMMTMNAIYVEFVTVPALE
jgi:hypothetical protein